MGGPEVVVSGSGGAPLRFKPYVDLYRERLKERKHDDLPIAVHSPGHIAETDKQAREEYWSGYKAMRADILRSLDLRQSDFSIEPEITGKVCKQKLRIYEIPISYYGRTYDEGKKITWRDGVQAVRVLLAVRLG